MSVLGLTIDYGPYGWIDPYDPDWTPNTTDAAGRRYRFGWQPRVAHWNLIQLANAIYPVLGDTAPLEAGLAHFESVYRQRWRNMMMNKLGLDDYRGDVDGALLDDLDTVLRLTETDMTLFYRHLATLTDDAGDPLAVLADAYYAPAALTGPVAEQVRAWLRRYLERCATTPWPAAERHRRMNAVNPRFVLRNYIAQLAIDAAEQADFSVVQRLQNVLRRPYEEQPDAADWAGKRPEWARERVGCSMLSCSS
jgi:uncharacterized protein YdiU (UPF0061 family)